MEKLSKIKIRPDATAALLLLLVALTTAACTVQEEEEFSQADLAGELQGHISWLADPGLEGRLAGTKNEVRAANYIADQFREYGLERGGDGDTYVQLFPLEGPIVQAMNMNGHMSRNIIGIVPGSSRPGQYLVIGAHYDGQGKGGVISLDTGRESVVHPGADDNASGTAVVLELARYFNVNRSSRTLVFITFSGEELGLLGSRYFVENSNLPEGEILAMINLDMVGRMEDENLSVMGTGTAEGWPELIRAANRDTLDIRKASRGSGASDHVAFIEKDIPALHYFTGTHGDYHRPGDTAEKINYEGTAKVAAHVKRVIAQLDTVRVSRLEFVKTGQPGAGPMQREGVTLGVQPDYVYEGNGLKIDYVRSGDPADLAGMKDGDIIREIDGNAVSDIFSYMEIIRDYSTGDTVEVKVHRNGGDFLLEVTF